MAFCPILEISGQRKGESRCDGEDETLHGHRQSSRAGSRSYQFCCSAKRRFFSLSLSFSIIFPWEDSSNQEPLSLSAFYSPPLMLPPRKLNKRTDHQAARMFSARQAVSLTCEPLVARKYTGLDELALRTFPMSSMVVYVTTRDIKLAFHEGLVHDELIIARLLKDQRSIIESSLGYRWLPFSLIAITSARKHSTQRKHGISTIFLEAENQTAGLCIT